MVLTQKRFDMYSGGRHLSAGPEVPRCAEFLPVAREQGGIRKLGFGFRRRHPERSMVRVEGHPAVFEIPFYHLSWALLGADPETRVPVQQLIWKEVTSGNTSGK